MCGTLESRPLGTGPLVSGELCRPSPAMTGLPPPDGLRSGHSTPGSRPSSPPAAHQPGGGLPTADKPPPKAHNHRRPGTALMNRTTSPEPLPEPADPLGPDRRLASWLAHRPVPARPAPDDLLPFPAGLRTHRTGSSGCLPRSTAPMGDPVRLGDLSLHLPTLKIL